jgi:hypothetical protein
MELFLNEKIFLKERDYMQYDVALVSRVSEEIEGSARRLKQNANTPDELKMEIQKIESSLDSLKSLNQTTAKAGANAKTAQTIIDQNQS